MEELTIKTSESGWVARVAKAYVDKTHVILIDDAKLGIDPTRDSVVTMGRKAELTRPEWIAVAVSVGIAATGVYLLIAAILDPEPFSKMAFTIGSGSVLLLGGGFSSIRVLTQQKPPNVRVTPRGFEIYWENWIRVID